MTSYASLRSAVDSMRMGAVDYIAKPFDHDEMVTAVKRVIGKASAAKRQNQDAATASHTIAGMIGTSDVMQARSEEHTSELQSRGHLVCRLLLEKKKTKRQQQTPN